jgi:hypothetical protein
MTDFHVTLDPSESALRRASEPFLATGGKLDPVFQRRMESLIAKKKTAKLTRTEAVELRKWLEIVDQSTIRLLRESEPSQFPNSKSVRRTIRSKRSVGLR